MEDGRNMDEAMLRFNEKLKQLLDVAKKKKNVLEYTEINQFIISLMISRASIIGTAQFFMICMISSSYLA